MESIGKKIDMFLLSKHTAVILSNLYNDNDTPIDIKIICKKNLENISSGRCEIKQDEYDAISKYMWERGL